MIGIIICYCNHFCQMHWIGCTAIKAILDLMQTYLFWILTVALHLPDVNSTCMSSHVCLYNLHLYNRHHISWSSKKMLPHTYEDSLREPASAFLFLTLISTGPKIKVTPAWEVILSVGRTKLSFMSSANMDCLWSCSVRLLWLAVSQNKEGQLKGKGLFW